VNKKYLSGLRKEEAIYYLGKTMEVAKKATCLRSKCGAIIVYKDGIIGEGKNHPPGNLESQRRCEVKKSEYNPKVTDKTCCIHAEGDAINDALKKNANKLEGSTLYFARLDLNDIFQYAGEPYCTICSKFALDTGIESFVLWHEKGIVEYNTKEYNDLSFDYGK
jgi:deoxycytidylate deaminase